MATFQGWCQDELIAERLVPLHIGAAFEVIVSRIDTARAAGSNDPMRTVSTSLAGPNSRAATHRMLASLGYSPSQRRIVHRLATAEAWGGPGVRACVGKERNLTGPHWRQVMRRIRSFPARAEVSPTRWARAGRPARANCPWQVLSPRTLGRSRSSDPRSTAASCG